MIAVIKIAEIWTSDFNSFADELERDHLEVTHVILDFLLEVRYDSCAIGFKRIFDIASAHNIPVIILTPYLKTMPALFDLSTSKYKNVRIIHWELFWFTRTYNSWKFHTEKNLQRNLDLFDLQFGESASDFTFPYITLNNISKNHRCLVMDLLAKNNLIDLGAIAWHDIRRELDNIRATFPIEVTDSVYCNYPYQYWKPKRMYLDNKPTDKFDQETLPVEFNQSFMQLVTESDDTVVFFSEKTATPILFNKPFLVASCVNFHKELASFGFLLYDELFDYSFDKEPDEKIRYEGLVENVKRYCSMDNQTLINKHKLVFEKLQYNKALALKMINAVPDEITEVIELMRLENLAEYRGPLNIFL